jgi:hypothetical protein
MSVIARELDYSKKDFSHASYQYSKFTQQSGGQTVTISGSGGQESIFELPPKVYNFSKFIMSYVATPTGVAAKLNAYFTDCIPEIRQIQLYTRSGLFLADIQFADNYTKSILKHEIKLEDMLTHDIPVNDNAVGHVTCWEGLHGMQLNISNAAQAGVPTYTYQIIPEMSVAGGAAPMIRSSKSPAYVVTSGTANTATPKVTRKFPLRLYKNSIFELDKDIYLGGETIYLRIVWNNPGRCYYSITALDGTVDGAAAGTNVEITNLNLYGTVEVNPAIEQALKQKVSEGNFSILLPYVYSNQLSINGSSQTINVRYNRAHGSKLMKIYWAPFNNTDTSITAYDHRNATKVLVPVPGSIIDNFYTTVNNIRTTQFNYDCTHQEDFLVKQDKLKGSCIVNSTEYYINFTWIEDFTDNYKLFEKPLFPDELTYVDGLDLNGGEILYAITASCTNATYKHYVFAVTQKTLMVGPEGVTIA